MSYDVGLFTLLGKTTILALCMQHAAWIIDLRVDCTLSVVIALIILLIPTYNDSVQSGGGKFNLTTFALRRDDATISTWHMLRIGYCTTFTYATL